MSNKYPEFFFRFSGSKHESVKKIGNTQSGWNMGGLIKSRLLLNLESLAAEIQNGVHSSPVCIFLVGGPGNGKTEAADFFPAACLRTGFSTVLRNKKFPSVLP